VILPGEVIARLTLELTVEPALFVATTLYAATSACVTSFRINVAEVAPAIGMPFFIHCRAGAGSPEIVAMKETSAPAATVRAIGWVMKTGFVPDTLRTALRLVTDPAEFFATTEYVPACEPVTLGNESFVSTAPLIATPSLNHCSVGAGEPVADALKATLLPIRDVAFAG
jgi:hypothetical protein